MDYKESIQGIENHLKIFVQSKTLNQLKQPL